MSGYRSTRFWLKPRRQSLFQRCLSRPPLRHASAKRGTPTSYLQPTPSQLLRFALTGSTQPVQNGSYTSGLEQHFKELFSEQWPLNTTPPPPLWSSLQQKTTGPDREVFLGGLKHDVRSLRDLHLLIERNVNEDRGAALLQIEDCRILAQALECCQPQHSYGEILSTINAITTRLERLRVPVSHSLYALGMYYACLVFSASALKRHLDGYLAVGNQQLDMKSSTSLVDALLESFQVLPFQETGHDISKMLNIVTGESTVGNRSEHNLHRIMCWADHRSSTQPIDQYLTLLAKLRSDSLLQELWDRRMKTIPCDSPAHTFQSAYDCVKALIDVGHHERAIAYLRQISKCAHGNLPGLSKFRNLRTLLGDEAVVEVLPQLAGEEYPSILEAQLKNMEKRLGITWNPRKSVHTSISDPHRISSQEPLLTIDGDCAGYDSTARLVAEIEALGCSKSIVDLGKIANLLDEHEGDQVLVSLSPMESEYYEFSWVLRRSSIEFSNAPSHVETDRFKHWSPSTLGLLCVRPNSNGISLVANRSLHLIQLGYLVATPKLPHETGVEGTQNWEDTGYIVTWDRVFGRFLIVFVGQSYGVLSTGERWIVSDSSFGLDPILQVTPGNDPPEQTDSKSPFRGSPTRYYVDVDPSPDLVF
ncbi:hypothetical protein BBP40_002839 [Aspergillus hancockii]|nr:hypothetical protein BBP40_002839 [Aspergillus hancockii]